MPHKTKNAEYPDEPSLLRAMVCNEDAALKILYSRNYDSVSNYIIQNHGTISQAKDIYQDAFVVVWRNIQSGRFHPKGEKSIDGYLVRIAKNKWIDYLRSPQFKQTSPLLEKQELEAEISDPDDQEEIKKIVTAFVGLQEKCRHLLSMYYYDKTPVNKIAAKFGWTVPTTRNNKYRCLQKLRMIIKNKK